MEIAWSKVLPVVVSIAVIILVAIVQELSPRLAAITATMPIGVPLALWIVWASQGGNSDAMAQFAGGLFVGLIPTLLFVIAAWILLKAGWGLVPVLAAGYAVWGVALIVMLQIQRLLTRG